MDLLAEDYGVNGQDPITACKLIQTYVIPILLYGLKVKNTERVVTNREGL